MIAVASKVDTCTYTVNELSRSHANIQHVIELYGWCTRAERAELMLDGLRVCFRC